MKENYKKTVVIELVIAILFFVIAPAFFIYLADPCQIFHKPYKSFLHHGFTPETRCQNAGLINSWLYDKNEGFDSIIIGSSISENFKPEYIQEKTPWKRTLNLNMVNISPVEQNIVARKSIHTGNVQHIFWEILPMLHHSPKPMNFDNIIKAKYFPAYLYNNSKLDDYRYIFNLTTLTGSLDVLTQENYFVDSINRIRYWENKCFTEQICNQFFGKEDIESIQKNYIAPKRYHLDKDSIKKIIYSDFDNYIFPIINEYCNTNISFDIFFPPFSMLWFAQLPEKDFNFELYLLRHTVEKTKTCTNVRVFAFYNELWITGDLSNYHDPKHFYGNIHNFIIDSIAENKNRINTGNISEFEETMINNLNAYQPYGSNLQPH